MAIHYDFHHEAEWLRVTVKGFDESLEEAMAYGQAVIAEAFRHRCRRILCDERELEYRLSVLDTYALAQAIVQSLPGVARVAIVHPPEAETADFFETVVSNRGMLLRVFADLPAAEAWLRQAHFYPNA